MNTVRLDYDKETGMLVRIVHNAQEPIIEGTTPMWFVLDYLPEYVRRFIADAEKRCAVMN